MQYLLGKGVLCVNSPDEDSKIPLFTAAQRGETDMVYLLLARRALTKLFDQDSFLCLVRHGDVRAPVIHAAATGGHVKILRELIDDGVDVDARDEDSNTHSPSFGRVKQYGGGGSRGLRAQCLCACY